MLKDQAPASCTCSCYFVWVQQPGEWTLAGQDVNPAAPSLYPSMVVDKRIRRSSFGWVGLGGDGVLLGWLVAWLFVLFCLVCLFNVCCFFKGCGSRVSLLCLCCHLSRNHTRNAAWLMQRALQLAGSGAFGGPGDCSVLDSI